MITALLLALFASASSLPQPVEVQECIGASAQECCSEFARFVIASKGRINTKYQKNAPKVYWAWDIEDAIIEGTAGFTFGCASSEYFKGDDKKFGFVAPLFIRCLPNEKAESDIDTGDIRCVGDEGSAIKPLNWNAIRASTQTSDGEVTRIQTLFNLFSLLISAQTARSREEAEIKALQDKAYLECIIKPNDKDHPVINPECAHGELGRVMHCLDFFADLSQSDIVADFEACMAAHPTP